MQAALVKVRRGSKGDAVETDRDGTRRTLSMVHCATNKLSRIFIQRNLKRTTVNTKASNLTQQRVKEWSDEGTLCLRFTDKGSASPSRPPTTPP